MCMQWTPHLQPLPLTFYMLDSIEQAGVPGQGQVTDCITLPLTLEALQTAPS